MGSPAIVTNGEYLQHSDSCDRTLNGASSASSSEAIPHLNGFPKHWAILSGPAHGPYLDSLSVIDTTDAAYSVQTGEGDLSSPRLADFVRQRFIPEFVEIKTSAGRAHFREILKYILLSEVVDCGCADTYERTNVRRKAVKSWPYMDSLRLCDIDENSIRHIVAMALESGYSIQTATHIRNVIRAVYSHAISTGSYTGRNPAALVTLPAVAPKDEQSLTLVQLKSVLAAMRFPESTIALFSILTDMNLVEICGLQWQYVNLSNDRRFVEDDWIPAKAIAIRNQWYRGEFRPAIGRRKRFIPVSDLLCTVLRDMQCNKQFARPQNFVLASRSGSPVYPGNIAKRRLKSIGQSCQMPWLSWRVFHRTHLRLKAEFGRSFHKEIERVLSAQCW